MMIKYSLIVVLATACCLAEARSLSDNDNDIVASIPSPNQEFNDEFSSASDIQRTNIATTSSNVEPSAEPSNEASVPVYVSPFARSERATLAAVDPKFEARQESSHAPPNYAPRPSAATSSSSSASDLKTSASYGKHRHDQSDSIKSHSSRHTNTNRISIQLLNIGHHHHGHHGYGYDHSGWLDMGAWTGGKGSFGWYADYPVGGKHHGYGRK